MFTKISFRNVVFIVLCVIFTLYAIDVIDINPKLIPLLLIVSIYLLTCKNWNIFSKENREEFNEDEKGTLVIPGNLKVEGELIVDKNVKTKDLNVNGHADLGTLAVLGSIQCHVVNCSDVNLKTMKVTNIYSMNGGVKIYDKVSFRDDCEMVTGKHFKHNGNSKSIYGVGEDKINHDDGSIGYEKKWQKGLHVVGIKDGERGRVVRLHSQHLSNIDNIHVNGHADLGTLAVLGSIQCHVVNCSDVNLKTMKVTNIYSMNGGVKIYDKVSFRDDCEMVTGKHFKHNGNSKSIYGVGEDKINHDDGSIGYEKKWQKGLHVVGIKDGERGRVVRLHSQHLSNIDNIHVNDGINVRSGALKFILGGQTIYFKYDGINQFHFWNPKHFLRIPKH